MPLEIQRGRSKWWYGRVDVNGRQLSKNLGVEIMGTPPASLRELGDMAFERSRAKAQAALEKLQLDLKRRSTTEELVQAIHEIRTGERIRSIALDDCAARWEELPRRRPLADRYLSGSKRRIAKFIKFLRGNYPGVQEMANVQAHMAREFLKREERRGVAPKTYNSILILLRSVFEALRRDAGMPENPFAGIPTRDGETVFRKPFTEEELGLIVKAAEADPFIYPLIVTGMCTAMRRGDRSEPAPLTPAELRARLQKMGPRTWRKIRDELLTLLRVPLKEVVPVEAEASVRRIEGVPSAV